MSRKTVLTFAGFDPSGGAGIQADIETVAALGGHALPIITCNTIQNTQSFTASEAIDVDWLDQQTKHLLVDIKPNAIKIGLLTAPKVTLVIKHHIPRNIPVVIDPVLRSGSGSDLNGDCLIEALKKNLFPLTSVITPNTHEARILTGEDSQDAAAASLIDMGCRYVLITGADEAEHEVENRLYDKNGLLYTYHYKKLPATYHGSGCTLSSAIAILLAQNFDIKSAVKQAQDFTWQALQSGTQLGKGQVNPKRIKTQTL